MLCPVDAVQRELDRRRVDGVDRLLEAVKKPGRPATRIERLAVDRDVVRMACHVLLTSVRRRLRLPECAGRASCRARRRSIARQIGNEGDSDARLEMQSKPPQGQMASRPFSRDEEKGSPLWDGSEIKSIQVISMNVHTRSVGGSLTEYVNICGDKVTVSVI